MTDEKSDVPQEILDVLKASSPGARFAEIPRRIVQQWMVCAIAVNNKAELLLETNPGKLVADRLLVSDGHIVEEMKINGIVVGDEKDFGYWHRVVPPLDPTDLEEYDDEAPYEQWRILPDTYDLKENNVLPILHNGDKIEVLCKRQECTVAAAHLHVTLFGTLYMEESDVYPYELTFDSGTCFEVNESRELRAECEAFVRFDRLWWAAGPSRVREFVIEQVCVGVQKQMHEGGALAEVIARRVEMDNVSPKMSVMIQVRNISAMPRIFRGKLIGMARKER